MIFLGNRIKFHDCRLNKSKYLCSSDILTNLLSAETKTPLVAFNQCEAHTEYIFCLECSKQLNVVRIFIIHQVCPIDDCKKIHKYSNKYIFLQYFILYQALANIVIYWFSYIMCEFV